MLSRLFLGRFAEPVVQTTPLALSYDPKLRRNVLPEGSEAISLLQLGTYRTDVRAPGESGDEPLVALGTLLTESRENQDVPEHVAQGYLGTLLTKNTGEGDPPADSLALLGTTKTATGEHSDVAEWF